RGFDLGDIGPANLRKRRRPLDPQDCEIIHDFIPITELRTREILHEFSTKRNGLAGRMNSETRNQNDE
ncbi:MAG TPA: hypothetical protein VHS31_09700, partial [Tepidisphaeraceae bacterium]|nr:hypothetical protein [Tepidisphaeraceae bacterium]